MSLTLSYEDRLAEGIVHALGPQSVWVVGSDVDRLVECLRQRGVEAKVAPGTPRPADVEPTAAVSLVVWIAGGCSPGGGTLLGAIGDLTRSTESVLLGVEGIERPSDDGSAGASIAVWLEGFSAAGFEPDL